MFFFIVVPMMLVDKLGDVLGGQPAPGEGNSTRRAPTNGRPQNDLTRAIFDGDWNLTAGQLLLRWYGHSPNPKRLVLLARDRVCLAASPRRTMSPTKGKTTSGPSRSSPPTRPTSRPSRASREATPPSDSASPTVPGWNWPAWPSRGLRGPLPANGQHVTCCQWRLLVCPVE
ncbi:hypothetical protein SALBM311S_09382 [Streptomyces alboniger]